jgi:hypothetical protein
MAPMPSADGVSSLPLTSNNGYPHGDILQSHSRLDHHVSLFSVRDVINVDRRVSSFRGAVLDI